MSGMEEKQKRRQRRRRAPSRKCFRPFTKASSCKQTLFCSRPGWPYVVSAASTTRRCGIERLSCDVGSFRNRSRVVLHESSSCIVRDWIFCRETRWLWFLAPRI